MANPTIVLIHGAFGDGSSWRPVFDRLVGDGHTVLAPPNPLRGLPYDTSYTASLIDQVDGPIVLVGHSYGGAVITNAATGAANVRALVYIDAFAPDQGEAVTPLAGPDSALAVADPTTVFTLVPPTLPPTPATDLYLKESTFVRSFANGIPARDARMLAATQRPATVGALNEPSGVPAWRTIPSWYLIGSEDLIIPPTAEKAMAERAGSTISSFHAGHLGLISDPASVARIIERAAKATA